jgi:hypothetical protein
VRDACRATEVAGCSDSLEVEFDGRSVGLTVGIWRLVPGLTLSRRGASVAPAIISSRSTLATPGGGACVRDSKGDLLAVGATDRGTSDPLGRNDGATDRGTSNARGRDETGGEMDSESRRARASAPSTLS